MTVIKIWQDEDNIEDDEAREKVPLLVNSTKSAAISSHRIELLPFSPKLIYFTLNMAL